MAKSGIYKITCVVTGRHYVGSAVNIGYRWSRHRWALKRGKHHSPKLQNAWDKYGETAFTFNVLELVTDINDLVAREQEWMDSLDAVSEGLNCRPHAGNQLGLKMSPESRANISRAQKGKKRPPYHRKALMAPRSPETREKIRQALKGRKPAPHVIAAMLAGRRKYTTPYTAEHRKNISVALMGRKRPDDVRRAISAAQTGRKASLETRAKMSASQKQRIARAAVNGVPANF